MYHGYERTLARFERNYPEPCGNMLRYIDLRLEQEILQARFEDGHALEYPCRIQLRGRIVTSDLIDRDDPLFDAFPLGGLEPDCPVVVTAIEAGSDTGNPFTSEGNPDRWPDRWIYQVIGQPCDIRAVKWTHIGPYEIAKLPPGQSVELTI